MSGLGRPGFFVLLTFILFALVFCSVSLVNHYLFRTYAADLGIVNHALYSFAHGRADTITLHLYSEKAPFLGDHFSPVIYLFVPFYFIFGTYTLLVLQIASILAGGWALYLFTRERSRHTWLPLLVLVYFFTLWPHVSALSFDFHTNVTGAMLLPWLVLVYFRNSRAWTLLVFVLMLITRETMSIWLVFIMMGLMILRRKPWKEYFRLEIPLMLFAALYFYVVVDHVMPWFQQGEGTRQIALYANLGGNIPEIIRNLLLHPQIIFDSLFKNTLPDPTYDGIKAEFHWMVLISGGIVLLVRPAWLLMLVPVYAQKFLTNNFALWGINAHYSIEFAPVMAFALYDMLDRIRKPWISYSLAGLLILSSLTFSVLKLENRKALWYGRDNARFYHPSHYKTDLHIKEVNAILSDIPSDKALSVCGELAPHLAFRPKIYHFPIIRDADMIVLFSDRNYYPLFKPTRDSLVNQLLVQGTFEKILNREQLLILRRVSPSGGQ